MSTTRLNNAYAIATEVLATGRRVSYLNGHFRELVRRCTPVLIDNDESNRIQNYNDLAQLVVNSTNRTKPNGEDYMAQLADLSDLYLRPAVARINTLRHRLIPFILKMVSEVERNYTESVVLTPEIREVPIPDLYMKTAVQELTAHHARVGIFGTKNISFLGGFNDRTEAEILALLKTGSTTFNDAILDIVSTQPSGWLKSVYDRYLLNGDVIPYALAHNNYIAYLNEALVIYILFGNMINQEIFDSGINLSREEYTKQLTVHYAMLGAFLNRYVSQLHVILSDKEIVQHWDRDNNVIYVYQPVYQEFLSKKGDVDALLGALHRTGKRVYMGHVLENAQTFAQEWNQAYQSLLKQREVQFIANIRTHLGQAILTHLPKEESKLIALFAADIGLKDTDILNLDSLHYDAICGMILKQYDRFASKDIYLSISHAILNCPYIEKQGFKTLYFSIDRKVQEANQQDIMLRPEDAAFLVMLEEVTKAVLHTSFTITPM